MFCPVQPCTIVSLLKSRMFVSTAEMNTLFLPLICFRVKEDVFWRNYFYRVSLIKQSAQLTALAAQQKTSANLEAAHQRGEVGVWLFNVDIVSLEGLIPVKVTHTHTDDRNHPILYKCTTDDNRLFFILLEVKLQHHTSMHRKNKQISDA